MTASSRKIYDVIVKRVDEQTQKTVFLLPDGQEIVADDSLAWSVGRHGVLTQLSSTDLRFSEYAEQRLRKVGERPPTKSGGDWQFVWQLYGEDVRIYTKAHFIPGNDGEFISDQTQELKLPVPPEFIAVCESRGLTAEGVLKGFIADLCELRNFISKPREDGYSSNGSDEREYANRWFDRAYPDWNEPGVLS